jgi:hypothetical protein
MKLTTIVVLATLLVLGSTIPWKSQIALLNSLEVGRAEDPMVWACAGCDSSNKPLQSAIIEDNKKDVKSILSLYPEYTVLAFRYTANLHNVYQDILWAIQVDLLLDRFKMNQRPQDARCKESLIRCGIPSDWKCSRDSECEHILGDLSLLGLAWVEGCPA